MDKCGHDLFEKMHVFYQLPESGQSVLTMCSE